MKKTLLMLAATVFLCHSAIATPCNVPCDTNKVTPCEKGCKQYNVPKGCEENKCETPCEKKTCKNTIEEDNKCFFDNQFKQMKKVLCLSPQQESAVDCIYDKYKNQMQILHNQAECRQEKLCKMINDCASNSEIREQKNELKEIRNDAKEQYRCFSKEIKAQLCKDQIRCFNRFNRAEKRKMKKLAKYCLVPHFPCDCGCKIQKACGCN